MLFLLLTGTAGGIAGDNSTLGLLEISLIWGQYAKNRFFARWLKNERVVDQTTRVSNLTVLDTQMFGRGKHRNWGGGGGRVRGANSGKVIVDHYNSDVFGV